MKTTYTVSINNDSPIKKDIKDEKPVSTFRTLLPQILASTAKNLLLVDLGLAIAFPTIVIPVLTGLQNDKNPNEILFFTAAEASWFASIPYVCQPIGSVLSGWVSEPIGRKKAMILVNIPHIIAWIMLYFAKTKEEVFFAAILLGLGVGFMEAPIVTYVGEICQPSIRGILTACSGVAATLGFSCVFFLGTVTTWRNVALACLTIPVITVVAICFVPETPLWLLSKHRCDDALKSLQWLRGWVGPKVVEKEFAEMKGYSEAANSCTSCQKAKIRCEHPPPNLTERIKDLTRKRTIKPFLLVLLCFAFSQFSGSAGMRPYIIQIFQAYRIPIDVNWATVVVGVLSFTANIICMCIVKIVGKRRLFLVSIIGTSLSCISLGFYAINLFPPGYSSFIRHEYNHVINDNYGPMILLFAIGFFTSLGVTSIPWMLLSEVFPFKSRGFATGITAALNYVMAFGATKTYLNFENWLSLYGVIWLYGAIGLLGFVVMFFLLPETENRTLEDIELHFSDNDRKLTDINILKSSHKNDKAVEDSVYKIPMKDNGTDEKSTKGCDNKAFDHV